MKEKSVKFTLSDEQNCEFALLTNLLILLKGFRVCIYLFIHCA